MTNEIKIISPIGVNESKGNLDDFKEKKGDFSNKKNFEQILLQLKLLMQEGKLLAESGNKGSAIVDEIKNLEDHANLKESSDIILSEQIEQLGLVKFKDLLTEEINSKLKLDAIDIGLSTKVITDNNQTIDEAQILAYAKKMGLNQKAIELLFKNNNKSKNFSKTQLLASIRNIATSDTGDQREKLHTQPATLTKIKVPPEADELNEKSQLRIGDYKRDIVRNDFKSSLKTDSAFKEKSSEHWSSTGKKAHFEVEQQD